MDALVAKPRAEAVALRTDDEPWRDVELAPLVGEDGELLPLVDDNGELTAAGSRVADELSGYLTSKHDYATAGRLAGDMVKSAHPQALAFQKSLADPDGEYELPAEPDPLTGALRAVTHAFIEQQHRHERQPRRLVLKGRPGVMLFRRAHGGGRARRRVTRTPQQARAPGRSADDDAEPALAPRGAR